MRLDYRPKSLIVYGFTIISTVLIGILIFFWLGTIVQPEKFDENLAFEHVRTQLEFGARVPGSAAHASFILWAGKQLESNDWQVEYQVGEMGGHPLTNIIAKKGEGKELIFLTSHYDSRLLADQDSQYPSKREPVPGANDGASGVAVLIELSRTLDIPPGTQVWIILFDIEDNGNIPGWDWIMGSQYFAEHLDVLPNKVVNIDMIGDTDLNIFKEKSSNKELNDEIWKVASGLGYENEFIPTYAYSILDDHTPFLRMGISAIDIIDMDYSYWHTLDDIAIHVSARSLGVVGNVLEKWLE
jgi:hypothetical protein